MTLRTVATWYCIRVLIFVASDGLVYARTVLLDLFGLACGDDVEDGGDLVLHKSVDPLLDVLGLVALVLFGDVMLGESGHFLQLFATHLLLVVFVEVSVC